MLRLGGAALIFLASLLLSRAYSAAERKRLLVCEGLLSFVRFVREQVACFRTPTGDIYRSFFHKELEECGFLPALRERGFEAAVKRLGEENALSAEELRVLCGFAAMLGKGQTEGQLRLCDYTERALLEALGKRRENAPRQTRVFGTLSVTGGLMMIILLL